LTLKTDYKFSVRIPNFVRLIDYFFIVSSIILFATLLNFNLGTEVTFYVSIIVSFFLPGWIFLRLIGLVNTNKNKVGIIATLCLSFVCSLGFTSMIFFTTSFLSSEIKFPQSEIYLLISLLPLIKDSLQKLRLKKNSFSESGQKKIRLTEILILAWILLFFIYIISSLYPSMGDVPYLDIFRLYSQSKEMYLTPELFQSSYPWFHLILGNLDNMSSPPSWLFQFGIAHLSILAIFAFYIMSKSYLQKIENRAHILATVFFFVFSGFGWVFFIEQKLSLTDISEYFDFLITVRNATYWDVLFGQGPWLWFWFRPLTIGFTIFFVMLYLMKQENFSKSIFIVVSSLVLLTLGQIHLPELIIFSVLIFALAIFFPKIKLRLKETVISTLIAIFF